MSESQKIFIDKDWSLGIEDLTWERVAALELHDPIIFAVMKLTRQRNLTVEQTLIAMVLAQHHSRESLMTYVRQLLEHTPGPVVIPKE